MPQILLGKPVIKAIAADLRPRVEALRARGVTPALAIVRVGERPNDLSYESTVLKRADSLGVAVRRIVLPASVAQADLVAAVKNVNADHTLHGCLMFRPLPAHLNEEEASDSLKAAKDVDGAGLGALACVFSGHGAGYAPCTAAACLDLMDYYGIDPAGKHVVVAGRSLVIGRPVSMLLMERDATVTMCHSHTRNLEDVMRSADILVLATGRPRAYGERCFREGQIVLDVGVNFDSSGVMCGDADFKAAEAVLGESGAITPVPGGVGGITTSVLMKHVVTAAELVVGADSGMRMGRAS